MLIYILLTVLASAEPGTRADRAALFDNLLEKTMARESFSAIKNERLGLDVEKNMRRWRDELLDAETDQEIFHALVKLSNARKDRHLSVGVVPEASSWTRRSPTRPSGSCPTSPTSTTSRSS